jgi:hypothetical protein
VQDWNLTSMKTAPRSPADEIVASPEVQDILAHLSRAAESVALAGLQVQQALHRTEQLLARRAG